VYVDLNSSCFLTSVRLPSSKFLPLSLSSRILDEHIEVPALYKAFLYHLSY